MNKTISINISGVIFNIEEDAYLKLKQYLDTISGYFNDSEGGKEIMEDIESRIAELLQSRMEDGMQVVRLAEVEEVISIMGQPEDYFDGDDEQSSESKTRRKKRTGKKLFRDPDKKVLGGVLSGISAFFGWNPLWLRVFFLIVAITPFLVNQATAIVLYLIMWVVIPLARTTSEKLEMKGEEVNVDNIKKKVSETFNEVTGGAKLDTGFQFDKARDGVGRVFDVVFSFLRSTFKVFGRVFGFFLVLAGFLGLVAVITGFIDPGAIGSDALPYSYEDYELGLFKSPMLAALFAFGLFSQILIPLIVILFIGLILLFSIKFNRKTVFVSLGIAWVIGLAALLVSGLTTGQEFSRNSSTYDTQIIASTSDTLYIDTAKDDFFGDDKRYRFNRDQEDMLKRDGDKIIYGYPHLEIKANRQTDQFELRLEKESRGRSNDSALQRALNIEYTATLTDDELLFQPYFTAPLSDQFRGQSLIAQLQIPIGKTVYISENMARISAYPERSNRRDRRVLEGAYWIMTETGLEPSDVALKAL